MTADTAYSAKDAFSSLLSVQALLLAASTLASTIGHERQQRIAKKSDVPHRVAFWIAVLMTAVGVGGVAAWIDLFICERYGTRSVGGATEALALLAPLVAIPVLGFVAASWAKPD
jgi:hypothetical protein